MTVTTLDDCTTAVISVPDSTLRPGESVIERSARRKDANRTTVYYCHAYSSCERGTNENINRMIRRQFPKGTDFDKVTAAEVKRVETWLNDYPREILGFMSSAEAFKIAFDRAA